MLATQKANQIIDQLINNSFVQSIEITNSEGLIDMEKVLKVLKQTAEKYGKLSLNIPLVGILTFSSDDMEKLYEYIVGGAR